MTTLDTKALRALVPIAEAIEDPPSAAQQRARNALAAAAPALLDAAEERDKYRTAANVLCAAHIGLPQASCPACERDALRAELSWIDSVLARRPALDKPTRAANIEHAINVAKQADALRSEVARLREALTPSGSTKAAYIGEFVFSLPSDPFDGSEVAVPWTTIKDIMAAISKRAALRGEEASRE